MKTKTKKKGKKLTESQKKKYYKLSKGTKPINRPK